MRRPRGNIQTIPLTATIVAAVLAIVRAIHIDPPRERKVVWLSASSFEQAFIQIDVPSMALAFLSLFLVLHFPGLWACDSITRELSDGRSRSCRWRAVDRHCHRSCARGPQASGRPARPRASHR